MNGKISLFIMTQKGFEVLKAFVDQFGPAPLECVITAQDSKIVNDYYAEIRELCQLHHIPVFDRTDNNKVTAAYCFAISWKWLIHDVEKIITLHDSILPAYRGFAPLVSALINGEREIGVTAIYANAEFDRGDIILQKITQITYPIKIKEAIHLISVNYIDIILDVCGKIITGGVPEARKQDEAQASYSLWRDEEDYRIDWTKDAGFIKRFIDAVSDPYLGASCYLNGQLIRITDAVEEKDVKIENRTPGKVLFNRDGFPTVVCGSGLLRILNAVSDTDQSPVVPLSRFRSRFT